MSSALAVATLTAMIVLRRDREIVTMRSDLWATIQALAQQEGWRPRAALSDDGGARYSDYMPGRSVMARDARSLADALQRFINGERADQVEIDLAPLVQFVNFLRGGAFEIR